MKKLMFFCLALIMVAFTTTALAGTKANMKEVSFQMQYDDISVDDVDADLSTWVLAGKFGYFFTDNFAVGLGASYMSVEIDSDELSTYMIGLEPNYYFNLNSGAVPYIGLNAGMVAWDFGFEDDSEFYYGAQIGILAFLTDWAAIDFQGRYTTYEIESTDVDDFALRVGLNVYF